MRRLTVGLVVLVGVLAFTAGVALLFNIETLHAQEVDFSDAEYIGGRECRSCHRDQRDHDETPHALALQDVADEGDKALILGDFSQAEELLQIQFPGEESPRLITPEDITFAVGSGRHIQRYLYEVDRREHLVLPVQWNVVEQVWEPYTAADNWPDPAYGWESNCAGCHTTGLDTDNFRWEDDGVQCEACHGPGSTHADTADEAGRNPSEEELQQIRSYISLSPDPQVCGQCHSQGHEPEDNLPYPKHYLPGQTLLDDSVFRLVPPDDEAHWWPTGHAKQPNMQFNEWLDAAHATALETMQESTNADDTCLTCHSGDYRFTQARRALFEADEDREGSPPEPITLETAQYGVTCANCHVQHDYNTDTKTTEHWYALCVDCHTNPEEVGFVHHPVREMFVGETFVAGIDGVAGAHASSEDGPTCATCHLPDVPIETMRLPSHTLNPVIPASNDAPLSGTCAECHQDLTATDMRLFIDDTQDAVRNRLTVAFGRLANLTEPDAENEMREQYDQIVDALTFVQNDGSMGVHNYAYADSLLSSAETGLSLLSRPGVILQPTEAPAPTAIPAQPLVRVNETEESVPTGIQPMTLIIIGIALVTILVPAVAFFRNNSDREV